MKSKLVFILIALFIGGAAQAQTTERVKEEESIINLGVSAGFPIVGGFNAEFTPLSLKKFGLAVNYSRWNDIIPQAKTTVNYLSGGINFYPFAPKRGFYAGLEYGRQSIHATEIDGDETDVKLDLKYTNFKLGLRTKKRLFFRGEIGYSLITYNIDEVNDFLLETYEIEVNPTLKFIQLPNVSVGIGYRL